MKINIHQTEHILDRLHSVEINCRARTFDINRLGDINIAEAVLRNLKIPQKYWQGCAIIFHPPAVPNSYNYKSVLTHGEGTSVIVEKFSSGWFVTDISRVRCRSARWGGPETTKLILSGGAKANIPPEWGL